MRRTGRHSESFSDTPPSPPFLLLSDAGAAFKQGSWLRVCGLRTKGSCRRKKIHKRHSQARYATIQQILMTTLGFFFLLSLAPLFGTAMPSTGRHNTMPKATGGSWLALWVTLSACSSALHSCRISRKGTNTPRTGRRADSIDWSLGCYFTHH